MTFTVIVLGIDWVQLKNLKIFEATFPHFNSCKGNEGSLQYVRAVVEHWFESSMQVVSESLDCLEG